MYSSYLIKKQSKQQIKSNDFTQYFVILLTSKIVNKIKFKNSL
jgi:hypothetical protein